MQIRSALKKIIKCEDLEENEMIAVMNEIMTGATTPAQLAGFLIGLEVKGPTVVELTAAAKVMRAFSNNLSSLSMPVTDIVGTGGDSAHTFNISTTCSFVIAGAGGNVAKHGNRAVSSASGSADVIEHAGINLHLSLEEIKQCIEQIGVGFLFAPHHHPALKIAAAPRKELGVRTFFNLLGPLTNPANAVYLMVGVYSKKWLPIVAHTLVELGAEHALVVHSQDGLDEISIAAPTDVAELKAGKIRYYEISPVQFGFKLQSLTELQVNNTEQSYSMMMNVLNNIPGPWLDITLLNAGAGIYISGLVDTLEAGIVSARETIASGKALEKLKQLINFSQKRY